MFQGLLFYGTRVRAQVHRGNVARNVSTVVRSGKRFYGEQRFHGAHMAEMFLRVRVEDWATSKVFQNQGF